MIVHPQVDGNVKEIVNIVESLFCQQSTELHDEMILLQLAGWNGETDDWMCAGGTRMVWTRSGTHACLLPGCLKRSFVTGAHAVLHSPWAWLTDQGGTVFEKICDVYRGGEWSRVTLRQRKSNMDDLKAHLNCPALLNTKLIYETWNLDYVPDGRLAGKYSGRETAPGEDFKLQQPRIPS